ncbi:efflux RND transporter periplasmic adaptor subunit [Mobilicoccus massiliensis]|uniref:efflux RND transporter periplasmic adaptor subunit n=1 Tax=Mobilicoccus massiliensis TaxID=1522310 RepID=UPI00058AD3A6|nr:efflux RND transporter periplasmic adaptor subunit [Mobilicoccus massiliensis]
METVRRYVFPIIWMVILAVIAASLAKIAFFPSGAQAAGGDETAPTASLAADETVPVTKADISSSLDLNGTVQPDPGTTVAATTTGEINKIWVKNGDTVNKGTWLLQVKVPKDVEPVAPPAAPSGVPGAPAAPAAPVAPAAPAPAQQFTYHTLISTGSGTVRDLKAAVGRQLNAGDTVATLSPGTYAVVADLTPEQQLDLLDRKVEATATLPTTAAPVKCDSTRIEEDEAGEDSENAQPAAPQIDPMTGMPAETSTSVASLRCAVPPKAKVVPGLAVKVKVALGSAKGVLTVPTTAVEGSLSKGAVYLVDENGGEPARHEVGLGLRGEDVVEIKSGLKENQQVLRFVPGVDNPDAGGMPAGPGW